MDTNKNRLNSFMGKLLAGITCGNIHDYEAGTSFFECCRTRPGKKKPAAD
jgi:hypothetical protein